jgi:hypothetical protein
MLWTGGTSAPDTLKGMGHFNHFCTFVSTQAQARYPTTSISGRATHNTARRSEAAA